MRHYRHLIHLLPLTALPLLLLSSARLQAASEEELLASNRLQVVQWDSANRQNFAASTNHLLRRAVVADRQAGSVTIIAAACGLKSGEVVEFGIVGETSDRTYEALFQTFAKAEDLGDALEFIGLPRGANFSSRQQRLWPSGERVVITVAPFKPDESEPLALEAFIHDAKNGGELARSGFVYCGSPRVIDPDSDRQVALADLEAPVSILSLYNEPQTLLDVPRMSPQGEVYERYTAHPQRLLPAGQLMRLTLRPEPRPDAKPRLLPLALRVTPGTDGANPNFSVTPQGETTATFTDFASLLTLFKGLVQQQRDPMVTLYLDDALTLAQAREIATILEAIEGENGIRLEPPATGQLYYKAFLPDERWRRREERLSQPWELHVSRNDAAADQPPTIKLVQTKEDWSDPDSLEPKLTPTTFTVASWQEMAATLESKGHGLPVLLVYAPAAAPLRLFMEGVRLVQQEHATIYVFAE